MMNSQFLQDEKVGHVVNTAKGLEIFGPKYLVGKGFQYLFVELCIST